MEQVFSLSEQYLHAYFKKGPKQVIDQALNNQTYRQKDLEEAAKLLQRKPDDPTFLTAANLLNSARRNARQSADLNPSGFIGRVGTQYGFPGTTEQNSPVSINHNRISADGIRLLMEAFRDTFAPLPVLAKSTAATLGRLAAFAIDFNDQGQLRPERDGQGQLLPDWENKYLINSDGTIRFILRYDRRDPTKSAIISISDDKFQDIEARPRNTEAEVAGIIGKAIRGGSWGALNNEAIATLVETAAGVLAPHTLERGEWRLLAQEDPLQSATQP